MTTPSNCPFATLAPDNQVYFAGNNLPGYVYKIDTSGTITELATTTQYPFSLAVDEDGNVWYATSNTLDVYGKITPGGSITEYPINDDGYSGQIRLGFDGNLYVGLTSSGGAGGYTTGHGYILKINPADGSVISSLDLGNGFDPAYAMTFGFDGKLYVFDYAAPQYAVVDTADMTMTIVSSSFDYGNELADGSAITLGDGSIIVDANSSGSTGAGVLKLPLVPYNTPSNCVNTRRPSTGLVAGKATLSSGTATVGTTAITTNTLIVLQLMGAVNAGVLSVENLVPGVGFDIVSSSATDASSVAWYALEP
jgi:sugar lactone lactonase YvrE